MIPGKAKLLLWVFLPFLMVANAKESKKKTVKVEFEVVYSLSERYVDPFMIEVYSISDSSKVSQERGLWRDGEGRLMLEAGKKYKATVYAISFNAYSEDGLLADPEYEPAFVDIDLSGVTKNLKLDQVRIRNKMHRQLGEATVTSSRILFYHKGDTLVYNASEFVLAEGSMIDALIKQLPGVTLKDNGEITVNGRKVDDLLLNGKDLFNGNRQLMLENIGAYTVKDIAIYEKNTLANEVLGRDDKHEKRYSMDVRLKRQYSTGWNGSIEAGYGTHNRYLGKLFAMLFSDNVNFNIHGTINNLSSGVDKEAWAPDKMSPGVRETKTIGLSYQASGQANRWSVSGWADVSHIEDESNVTTITENFLPEGNNYQYGYANSRTKQLTVETNHYIMFGLPKKAVFNITPRFNYEKRKADGSNISALFSDDVQNVTADRIRSIYRGYTSLADTLIYRNINQNVTDGHSSRSIVMADGTFNVRSNKFRLTFLGTYDTKKENMYQLYQINHATNPTPTTQDFQHRDMTPDHTRRLKGMAEFFVDLDWAESRIGFDYFFENTNTVNTSNIYSAADWDLSEDASTMTIAEVQALPGFNPVYSPALSDRKHLTTDMHHVSAWFHHVNPIRLSDKYNLQIHFTPLDLRFSGRSYYYETNNTPVLLKRNSILPKADGFVRIYKNKNNGASVNIGYTLDSNEAPMQSMITQPQIDPMNVYIGNPDLKRSLNHMVRFSVNATKGQQLHMLNLNARFMHAAVAQGYIFNTVTGVRYYHPFNVNGNWDGYAAYTFFLPFGKGNKFMIQNSLAGNYVNSVDLIGTSVATEDFQFDSSEQKRRYVKDSSVEDKFEFSYTAGSNKFSAVGEVKLSDYRSKDPGFSNFTSMTARYGVSGVVALPAGFGVSTDVNVYTRRGFTDSRLNTTDVVWNARLTKSVMKGSIMFAVNAYDILHQLSNIAYTVNAQARTEVVRNVVPAYVLFQVQYRFNKDPKK